jgi:hypothetical protein
MESRSFDVGAPSRSYLVTSNERGWPGIASHHGSEARQSGVVGQAAI